MQVNIPLMECLGSKHPQANGSPLGMTPRVVGTWSWFPGAVRCPNHGGQQTNPNPMHDGHIQSYTGVLVQGISTEKPTSYPILHTTVASEIAQSQKGGFICTPI